MYEHPAIHDHVAGWPPARSGQHNAEVHLSFKDASAQRRQQLASGGTCMGQQRLSRCLSAQLHPNRLPDATMVRMHNVPEGINDHGRTPIDYLRKHSQFGPEYTVVSESRGDASGDVAFFFGEGEILITRSNDNNLKET